MFGLKRRQPSLQVDVRWIESHDFQEVLAIGRRSLPKPRPEPWSKSCLTRVLECEAGTTGIVAEVNGQVAGFAIFKRPPTPRGIVAAMHIRHLAVSEQFRRRGIGRKLIASIDNRAGVIALVHERNLAAQCFFRSLGFRAASTLRSYFKDGQDGYLFIWRNA